ncbi:MAG: AAA family ATPase [Candidatus Eisenbacteria bacterium]|nr:AAA family ATPase [Candidatus Eisenbacteria bacterium]
MKPPRKKPSTAREPKSDPVSVFSGRSAHLPLIALRDTILFPGVTLPFYFSRARARAAIKTALLGDRRVFAVLQRDAGEDRPGPAGLHEVGTVARVVQVVDGEAHGLRVVLQGELRARWRDAGEGTPALQVAVEPVRGSQATELRPQRLERLRRLFSDYAKREPRLSEEVAAELGSLHDPEEIVSHVAAHVCVAPRRRQEVLQATELPRRVRLLESLMKGEIRRLRPRRASSGGGRTVPAASLGGGHGEAQELLQRVEEAALPERVRARAVDEARRLSQMPPMSPEGVVVRNYVDWLLALPWKRRTRDRTDLERARTILNEDHEGLEPIKERILEALAVIGKTRRLPPTVLAFVGPPGVGKTSLGRSIARVLGRRFARISLGGIRDEAEIRGHRRTYVGAMPGRILQAMRRVGSLNPVLLMDEVDKLGKDFRGDPAAALLEVLDPEQNRGFSDHYLEIDYSLRQVLFLVTANTVDGIPPALRDRLEVLPLPGYHEAEKVRIARHHLIPRLERQHGLDAGELDLGDQELHGLIRRYTREAGVRGAERCLARLCRREILRRMSGGEALAGGSDRLEVGLGPPPVPAARYPLDGDVGKALALGVTPVGGEILPIEVMIFAGRGRVRVTGGAGAGLRDSVRAALTCARARGHADSAEGGVDIHVHLPRGELSKDGPSAGAAVFLALASAMQNRRTRDGVALTGEITLRGRILPVGGLREKLLAAWREGARTVLYPAQQQAEIEALPQAARTALRCVPVSSVDPILKHGLQTTRARRRPLAAAA